MPHNTDPVELAEILSEIAAQTSDAAAAVRLLELARKLLAAGGLRDGASDDDMPPNAG
jgi:hypothetical protein